MRVLPLAASAIAFLAACPASPPPPGKAVAIEGLCEHQDGSRVRLSGTLRYRRGLMSFCSTFHGAQSCDLALLVDTAAPPDFNVLHPNTGPAPVQAKLSVPVGGAPGRMDSIPERFKPADIQLHLEGGGTATDGDRVTIDGKLSVIPSAEAGPKSCFVYVDWASPAR